MLQFPKQLNKGERQNTKTSTALVVVAADTDAESKICLKYKDSTKCTITRLSQFPVLEGDETKSESSSSTTEQQRKRTKRGHRIVFVVCLCSTSHFCFLPPPSALSFVESLSCPVGCRLFWVEAIFFLCACALQGTDTSRCKNKAAKAMSHNHASPLPSTMEIVDEIRFQIQNAQGQGAFASVHAAVPSSATVSECV